MPSEIVDISFSAREDIKPASLKTTKDLSSLQVHLISVNANEEELNTALVKKILIKLI